MICCTVHIASAGSHSGDMLVRIVEIGWVAQWNYVGSYSGIRLGRIVEICWVASWKHVWSHSGRTLGRIVGLGWIILIFHARTTTKKRHTHNKHAKHI